MRISILSCREAEAALAAPFSNHIDGVISVATPLADVANRDRGVSRPASLLDFEGPVMRLDFSDTEDAASPFAAKPDHVANAVTFARAVSLNVEESFPEAHLLVHCRMGHSRSAALALAIHAALNPGLNAGDLQEWLLGIRPTCSPNIHVATLADELLERDDLAEVARWLNRTICFRDAGLL